MSPKCESSKKQKQKCKQSQASGENTLPTRRGQLWVFRLAKLSCKSLLASKTGHPIHWSSEAFVFQKKNHKRRNMSFFIKTKKNKILFTLVWNLILFHGYFT